MRYKFYVHYGERNQWVLSDQQVSKMQISMNYK